MPGHGARSTRSRCVSADRAACLRLADAMRERGETGAIVTLLGDRGERYAETLFDDGWLATHGIDPAPALSGLRSRVGVR